MKMSVLLFAAAKEAAGAAEVDVELPTDATVATMRATLVGQFPELKQYASSLLIAVDNKYAEDSLILGPDNQVACFPPVSGG